MPVVGRTRRIAVSKTTGIVFVLKIQEYTLNGQNPQGFKNLAGLISICYENLNVKFMTVYSI